MNISEMHTCGNFDIYVLVCSWSSTLSHGFSRSMQQPIFDRGSLFVKSFEINESSQPICEFYIIELENTYEMFLPGFY